MLTILAAKARITEFPRGSFEISYPSAQACSIMAAAWGCFLSALKVEGFSATGVEFDEEAAAYAAKNADCLVFSTASFFSQRNKATYDALHLGDVLEHLPEPGATLRELLGFVKPGGLLFVEGPLETNPSPVFWVARLFGVVKRLVRPNFIGSSPPTHLLRVNAVQQLTFFTRVRTRSCAASLGCA